MVAGKACDGVWGYPPQGNALKKGVWGIPQPEQKLCMWNPHGIPQPGQRPEKRNNMKKAGKNPAFACLKDYLEAKLPK